MSQTATNQDRRLLRPDLFALLVLRRRAVHVGGRGTIVRVTHTADEGGDGGASEAAYAS